MIEEVPTLDAQEKPKEQFRICEINARFAFNGFLITAYGQQALLALGAEENGFSGGAESAEVSNKISLKRIFPLFI